MGLLSLNRHITWSQVLPLLDVAVEKVLLPALLTCPFCSRQRLMIYSDGPTAGEWYHCHACRSHGDIIEFASKSWKLDIPNTIAKLVELGIYFPSNATTRKAINDYTAKFINMRRRMDRVWHNCREAGLQGSSNLLQDWQRLLNANIQVPSDWMVRGGRFVGSTRRCYFENEIASTVEELADPQLRKCKKLKGIRGPGWDELVVIPFYRLPGLISGFLLIGKDGNPDTDWYYWNIYSTPHTRSRAGLTMLDAVGATHPHLHADVFVLQDIKLAMALQARNFRTSVIPLPIICGYHDSITETTSSWDLISKYEPIFWDHTVNVDLLKAARLANGRVSMYAPPSRISHDSLNNDSSIAWLRKVAHNAVSWSQALRQHLQHMQVDQIESVFLSMGMSWEEVKAFTADCQEELKTRIERVYRNRNYAKQIRINKSTVVERPTGWYELSGEDALICDAIIRIKQVITTPTTSYYRGVILFGDEEIEFTEKAAVLDRDLFGWATKYVRDVAKAGLITYAKTWSSAAVQLVTQFHTPETVQGAESVGWDGRRQQFNFPTFSIQNGGELTTEFSFIFKNKCLPGADLDPPQELSLADVESLAAKHDESRLCWGIFVHTAANLLAPMFNQPLTGLMLDGQGAGTIGCDAARRLGCRALPLKLTDMTPATTIGKEVSPYRWPVVIPNTPRGKTQTGEWLRDGIMTHTIMEVSSLMAAVLSTRADRNILRCRRMLGTVQSLGDTLHKLMPAYLADVCQRRGDLKKHAGGYFRTVLHDIADWFDRQGGNPKAVLRVASILTIAGTVDPWKAFLVAAVHLYISGDFTFVRDDEDSIKRTKPAVVFLADRGGIWIPIEIFAKLSERSTGLQPDMVLIEESLHKDGPLIAQGTYQNERGWLIQEEAWNETLKSNGSL